MKVSAILDAKGWEVLTIEPDTLVLLALHEMNMRNVGALVVTEDGEHVRGMISDRDIARALIRHGNHLLSLQVRKVMSRLVPVCRPDDDTNDCMLTMTEARTRHLPVVDGGRLCGLISIGDLVKNRLEELELERNVLRDYVAVRALP
ncbi:MAG: CBS domain-containing protein [Actinomycetota bacterium]|nr:CBS domain-containing protein [Actinomycetota bacterium]